MSGTAVLPPPPGGSALLVGPLSSSSRGPSPGQMGRLSLPLSMPLKGLEGLANFQIIACPEITSFGKQRNTFLGKV